MKKILLYILLGLVCFLLGYFAINFFFAPKDTVYNDQTEYETLDNNDDDKNKNEVEKKYINNVDVTDLSYNEAVKKLKDSSDIEDETLKILIDSNSVEVLFTDLGISYDYEEAIKRINEENVSSENSGIVSVNASIVYNDEALNTIISYIKENYEIPLEKDKIVLENGVFKVTTSNKGYVLNEEKAYEEITKSLDIGETTIKLTLEEVDNSEMLKDINDYFTVIGEFTTKYTGSTGGRINNLKVASDSINGFIVYPGEIFSTNTAFSPYTREKGYSDAAVIVGGELVDGIGGGVCQVSSTLYNALLYAELDIVEKYNHSLKVGYADYGFDAVLASTYKDLKFRNDTSKPVYIESYVGDGIVKVVLYGQEIHDENRVVTFSNKLINSVAPPEPLIIEDGAMYEGEELVKLSGLYGHKYELYKHIYDGDTLVSTEFVATSVYSTRQEQRVVGTKPLEQGNEQQVADGDGVEVEVDTQPEAPVVEDELIDVQPENPVTEDIPVDTQPEQVEDFNDEGLVINNEEIEVVIENGE